jgi:radical SAM superfamily enzyme YgiQ (UPF0313 family)
MKILLVAPQFTIFPVGIAYIASSLKQSGYHLDGYIYDKSSDLIDLLQDKNYDIVATGGLSSQYAQIKAISDITKKLNRTLIVGGGIITSEPELMSRSLNVDYAVIGEGELAIVDLLSCLAGNGDISQVKGIGYFQGGGFILTAGRKQIEDLDALPWPDYDCFGFSAFLDTQKPTDHYYYDLFDEPREYPLVASRSCPFLCTFCYHPAGDKYRQRTLESIFKELEVVIPKYRINIVSLFDELFSYNEERVLEFCARFRELTGRFSWTIRWNCQMRVAGLKETMLDAMRDSGCYMVSYGLESYSLPVLKSMKKHITPEQIHHAVHATLDRRISIQGNFIFGDKAETRETVLETLEFWKDHREAGILLFFILACPNSAMYQHAIQKGIIKDRLDFIKHHLFEIYNMTTMPDWEFYRLVTLVFKHVYKYYFFAVPDQHTPDSVTVRCPHCEEIMTYRNYATKRYFFVKMMYCRNCRKRFFSASRLYILYANVIARMLPPFSFRIYKTLKQLQSKLTLHT